MSMPGCIDMEEMMSLSSKTCTGININAVLIRIVFCKYCSHGKLMKAYYAKQDAEKLSGKGDTSQKLTLMKTSADSLKKSADALNDSSLLGKK